MSEELKPCPFCGGKARLRSGTIVTLPMHQVYCLSCGAGCGHRYTEAEAIEAWNTRYEETCRMETDESCQNWNSCSVCGADYYNDQPLNYCPNCGARVVEE